jgi:serine/threonine protein kinase
MNGMAEIHKSKVLHRDLKPDNIFIDINSHNETIAKIGDFGLARMLDKSHHHSNTCTVLEQLPS